MDALDLPTSLSSPSLGGGDQGNSFCLKFIYDNWLDEGLSLLLLAVSMQGPMPMPHWLCPAHCSPSCARQGGAAPEARAAVG